MSSKYLSKSALATIKARQVQKQATKMSYKAAAKAASKTASKSQERKMEHIQDIVASALFPHYSAKKCNWCGAKGSTTELFCNCEWIVEHFGALGCDECNIYYGTFSPHTEYLTIWGTHDTYWYYLDEMRYWMKPPCAACSPKYRKEYETQLSAFMTWKNNVDAMDNEHDDYYDDPCTSGRGGICRCCGD